MVNSADEKGNEMAFKFVASKGLFTEANASSNAMHQPDKRQNVITAYLDRMLTLSRLSSLKNIFQKLSENKIRLGGFPDCEYFQTVIKLFTLHIRLLYYFCAAQTKFMNNGALSARN